MEKLRILIPKGRIFESISKLFSEAGIPVSLADRTYRPDIGVDWLDAKIMKPQNVGNWAVMTRDSPESIGLKKTVPMWKK